MNWEIMERIFENFNHESWDQLLNQNGTMDLLFVGIMQPGTHQCPFHWKPILY